MAGVTFNASEKKANTAAHQLVKALRSIEAFNDDPEMVIDAAQVISNHDGKGVKDALEAIKRHYITSE